MRVAQAIILLLLVVGTGPAAGSAERTFQCATDPKTGWLTSIRRAGDSNRVEFIRPGQALGAVRLRVRVPGLPWREVSQSDSGVNVCSRFLPRGEALHWEVTVKNVSRSEPLEIGDLALPLPMNTDYVLGPRGNVPAPGLPARLHSRARLVPLLAAGEGPGLVPGHDARG